MRRRLAALTSLAVLALAGTASAHVTVQSPGATQGGYAKLTFRVPSERDVATTKLEVVFPGDAPLASASTKPHPGWTVAVKKTKPATPLEDDDGNTVDEVVSSITWTATDGGIKQGEFDEFEVSAGPLPEVDEMVFKALQTYADGDVVRWIEPRTDGAEPEHPAPVLALAAAGADDEHAGMDMGATAAPSPSTSSAATVTASADSDSSDSDVLPVTALAVGGLALLLSLVGLVRGRKAS